MLNRSHVIVADVEIPEAGAEGVIVAHGGVDGGYGLYVKNGRLHWVHNYVAKGYPTLDNEQTQFAFTGVIHSVTFDVTGDLIEDDELTIRRLMARQ